ncbi:dihydroxy-acid dehydratase, partial [Actinomadura adrarensis]
VAAAGRRIVELIAEDVRPRDILTPAAFRDAVTAMLAISASVNTLKHLQAVAVEAGTDADIYALFEELAPKTPLLAAVKPNGTRRIDEFESAGGTQALLHSLSPLLNLDRTTVAGPSVRTTPTADPDVIRPLDNPFARHPGIVLVRGTLAPDGGVAKRTVADDGVRAFRGPAKVFRSRE